MSIRVRIKRKSTCYRH